MSDMPPALRGALDAPAVSGDTTTDRRGRTTIEFDEHGLRADRARCMAAALRWAQEVINTAMVTRDYPENELPDAIAALEP